MEIFAKPFGSLDWVEPSVAQPLDTQSDSIHVIVNWRALAHVRQREFNTGCAVLYFSPLLHRRNLIVFLSSLPTDHFHRNNCFPSFFELY